MISGSKNKGDWSEFYALIYLLGTRKLAAANEKLEQIEDLSFPILNIIRDEKQSDGMNHKVDYRLIDDDMVEVYFEDNYVMTKNSKEFLDEANRLKEDIVNGKGRSFDIVHAEEFLNEIKLERLTAPSQDVTDIRMKVHDINTGTDQEMGFSIKSYLGGAPTLFNASGATNFKYCVKGIGKVQMDEINAIDTRTKIIDRIAKIYEFGGSIEFCHAVNDVFSANLMMLDSRMEELIGAMLLYSYSAGCTDCVQIIDYLEKNNPMNYPRSGFYIYKFKKFLCAKALGLDPSKEWNGIDDANGGYIVVKSDGDIVAYHLYNRDAFEQYLFDNTFLERGSTSRHNYASLYMEDDEMYINLNLQIRFKEA